MEKRESLCSVSGNVNWYNHYGNPWRRKWQPTSVYLPGEFHGQKSLAGYSSWGHKESDMTEQLIHTHVDANRIDLVIGR